LRQTLIDLRRSMRNFLPPIFDIRRHPYAENLDCVNYQLVIVTCGKTRVAPLTSGVDGPTIILIERSDLTRHGRENGDRAATR
jgi:hypothetical protein